MFVILWSAFQINKHPTNRYRYNLTVDSPVDFLCYFFSGSSSCAVYQLISRRRFQQMEVLEGQNILVTISGKKNKIRVYYLSWLKSKILKTDGVWILQELPLQDLVPPSHFPFFFHFPKNISYIHLGFMVSPTWTNAVVYAIVYINFTASDPNSLTISLNIIRSSP